jgi:hypothetical protein
MRETRLGLTQWFNTDSGFEFNTLFNTFATVGINSHTRNPFNLNFFDLAKFFDGPEVALNWLFPYPI